MVEEYSPFDAPVKEPKTTKAETSGGIKMEQITDAELDGKSGINNDMPKDAPTFEIPKFNEIPDANPGSFGNFDPNAPGSSSSGGNNTGSGGGNSGGGGQDGGTKVDTGFAKEFSEYTAKWLVDIFFRLLIAGFQQYAKIDRTEIQKAINDGFIDPKFMGFVDEANKNVEKSINVTDDEKKFVIEPLKYFLEVKKVQLKPEWMFITGLLMVGGGLFIRSMDVKNQNKVLLDKIIKESEKIREDARGRRDPQEPIFKENVETFSTSEVEFPRPPKRDEVIEVEATEINNDDNA
jgi:hypothetical protein